MTNPCLKCKQAECPKICYPKKDYEKAIKKARKKNGKT